MEPIFKCGVNLLETNYYNTSQPQIDLALKSSDYVNAASSFNTSAYTMQVDASGNLSALSAGQEVNCYITNPWTTDGVAFSSFNTPGNYCILYWQGSANVSSTSVMSWAGTTAQYISADLLNNSAVISFTFANASATLTLRLKQLNADYFRNWRLIPQVYSGLYLSGQKWDPTFLSYIEPFTHLRFMDWNKTNDQTEVEWTDRRPYYYRSHAAGGYGWTSSDPYFKQHSVPWEAQIDLANTAQKHPWFNFSHLASNDYFRQAATLVRDNLDPDLVAYFEYSNECWNGIFDQADYCYDQGQIMFSSNPDAFVRQDYYYAWKVENMSREIRAVFSATPDRCKIVGAWQNGGPWHGEKVMGFSSFGSSIDIMATAPYMGGTLGGNTQVFVSAVTPYSKKTLDMTTVEIVSSCLLHLSSGSDSPLDNIGEYVTSGAPYGITEFAFYECGHHLAANATSGQNHQPLTDLLVSASMMTSSMQYAYHTYLSSIYEAGVSAMPMLFIDVSIGGKYGSWGLAHTQWSNLNTAWKYLGVQDFINQYYVEEGVGGGGGSAYIPKSTVYLLHSLYI
jgi:hypothetical protein